MLFLMIYLTSLGLALYISSVFLYKELTSFSQFLLVIPAITSLYLSIKNKKVNLPKSTYALIGFLLIAIISVWINIHEIPRTGRSFFALRPILFGILGIFIFRDWISNSTPAIKRWTLNLFLICLIYSSLYGIYQYFHLDQRRLNGLIYITQQGYGSSFILSLLIPAFLHRKKLADILSPGLLIATIIITFTALFLTFTRGAMLGLLCGLPLTLYYYRKKLAYYSATAIIVLTTAAGIYYVVGTQNSNVRFMITKENHSDNQRRTIWLASLYAFKERPVTGWGYFQLGKPIDDMIDKYEIPRNKVYGVHAHNNFLEVAATTGIFGLLFFSAWCLLWCLEVYRGELFHKAIFSGFIVNFLIAGQFERTIDHRLALIVFIIYALSASNLRADKASIS